jgi:hypothetical protein
LVAIASASSKRSACHRIWIGQIWLSSRSGECSRSAAHKRSASSFSCRSIAAQAAPTSSSARTKGYSIVPSTPSIPTRGRPRIAAKAETDAGISHASVEQH